MGDIDLDIYLVQSPKRSSPVVTIIHLKFQVFKLMLNCLSVLIIKIRREMIAKATSRPIEIRKSTLLSLSFIREIS